MPRGRPGRDERGTFPGGKPPDREYSTSEVWIDGLTIKRKVLDFGALPNAGSKAVNHGIRGNFEVLRSHASAFARGARRDGFTVPNSLAVESSLRVGPAQVVIEAAGDLSGYDAWVTIDFVRVEG